MSLLLKALKQAEVAKSADPEVPDEVVRAAEPAPLPPPVRPREWVEPPGLLFGNAVPNPPESRFAWQRPALLPTLAALATVAALAYAVYVYFALQSSIRPIAPAVTPQPAVEGAAAPAVLEARAAFEAPALDAAKPAAGGAELPLPVSPRARLRAPAAPAPASTPAARPTQAPLFQPDPQNAQLGEAYAAYQDGRLDVAQRLYTEAAARRRSVDALLGLAAIASVQNRDGDAQRLYREVLELEPRHALAQAALLDMPGGGDGGAVERLKALIAREPTPQLYQSLGNHYAAQGRWKDAQAAYFEAYRGAPDSADYAYNLAVGLDRLQQHAAALGYYQKALSGSGAHRFDRGQVQARIQQLNPLVDAHGTP